VFLARFGADRGTDGRYRLFGRVDIAAWLFEHIPILSALLASEWMLGLVFLVLPATFTAFGVPGVLVPISFSSGALLGGWEGIVVVTAGASAGSHALFLVTRRWMGGPVRRRWGEALERLDSAMARRGFFYLLGLRLCGAPHLLVTAASALSAIRAQRFVLATLLGFLPAISLASMAGSAI